MCAPVFGTSRVFVVDLDPARSAQVAKLGAVPINPADGDPIDQIAELNGNLGVDAVVEAVGNAASVQTAFSLPKIGGTLTMIGMLVDEEWPLTCGDNWLRELHIHPVLGNSLGHRSELLRLIESHQLDPASLISHSFPLADVSEAYEAFEAHEATKAVLRPCWACGTGRRTRITSPPPGRGSACTEPASAAVSSLTIQSPRPEDPGFSPKLAARSKALTATDPGIPGPRSETVISRSCST
jgi:hypothetical protein